MQFVRESDQPFRNGVSGVKYLMRGPLLDWGIILLLNGEQLSGHCHREVEETFYILKARGAWW
ncbi:MAG: hypothetical protein GXY52_07555 [Chloroflexi bacterium]|nr:hypothetical protein [Chloroflexota bacterium]